MKERNFKLIISFLGSEFFGWQKQKEERTVQGEIENALKKIFNKEIKVIGCGRTDSKVNGINYVANMKIETNLKPENIKNALNSLLPESIYVKNVKEVDLDFHSRYKARRKTYRYIISLQKTPFLSNLSFYMREKIDIEKMKKAAEFLIGRHDFKSFQSKGSSAKNTIREIYKIEIKKKRFFIDEDVELIIIDIEGSGFLYRMVRNIVGTLIYVGTGKIPPESVREILDKKDRRIAPPPVPAKGLYFKNAKY